MKKVEINVIPSVNYADVVNFIIVNSDYDKNQANTVLSDELGHIHFKLPDQIETVCEHRISKVIVNELTYDGWVKKFTEAQGLSENYYILFTD